LVRGDVGTEAGLVLADGIDAVLHFAAKSLVAESVACPGLYWRNNLGGTLGLLEAMRVAGTGRIVFSSTAAVYGDPGTVPIEETAPARPTSPYGASKAAVDTALAEHARVHGIGAVSLRYFNVAGAQPDAAGGWLGERHAVETHLIPSILAVALRGTGQVSIFGDDYPTADGTCVRDYIHVTDLAAAHVLALAACAAGEHKVYNLGGGSGFSNREVLAACQEVTGRAITSGIAPRRPGDPAVLVASSERITAELGWRPERGLREMAADAWAFTCARLGA
jgi:UDP-glucose 4-epimerase